MNVGATAKIALGDTPNFRTGKEVKVRLVLTALILLMALVGCVEATPTPRPTPTTASPQFESNEVIGIVHNKMIQECGARSGLGTFREAYSASPRHQSPLFDDRFAGIWDIIFDMSRTRYDLQWPVIHWEFYEDSNTVVQITKPHPLLWRSTLCSGG